MKKFNLTSLIVGVALVLTSFISNIINYTIVLRERQLNELEQIRTMGTIDFAMMVAEDFIKLVLIFIAVLLLFFTIRKNKNLKIPAVSIVVISAMYLVKYIWWLIGSIWTMNIYIQFNQWSYSEVITDLLRNGCPLIVPGLIILLYAGIYFVIHSEKIEDKAVTLQTPHTEDIPQTNPEHFPQ